MEEIYLSAGSAAGPRKGKILELVQRNQGRGRLSHTLHSNGGRDNHVDPSWVYDYDTNSRQVETIVETLDRHLADAFGSNDDQYRIASVKIIKSGLNDGGPSRNVPKSGS